MPHETRFKFKRGNDWVYEDDLEQARDERQQELSSRPGRVDVGGLPNPDELDDEFPFDQLVFEHPEVRLFITSEGKIRLGISPEQHCIAEQIIAKYKEKACSSTS